MDRKKKTVLMVTLVCVAMAAVAAGIILLSIYMEKRGGQKATESRQNAVTSTAVKAEEDALKDGAVADFVGTGDLKLGDYKGIEVDTEPTEDEVLEAMESQLLKMTKDHKGRIQEGDYVCVDYKGYIDAVRGIVRGGCGAEGGRFRSGGGL
jgi:FKBP-type peptidyl-prolyl cis-trans isomerase (trigger factor)